MADPRVQLLDDLIEGVDNIEGAEIPTSVGPDIWIHTGEQVRGWLVQEKQVLLRLIEQAEGSTPGVSE